MIKILRNPVRQHIKGWFRGREVIFKSKSTQKFEVENEEEEALYEYWTKTFQFIYDDTINIKAGDKK